MHFLVIFKNLKHHEYEEVEAVGHAMSLVVVKNKDKRDMLDYLYNYKPSSSLLENLRKDCIKKFERHSGLKYKYNKYSMVADKPVVLRYSMVVYIRMVKASSSYDCHYTKDGKLLKLYSENPREVKDMHIYNYENSIWSNKYNIYSYDTKLQEKYNF